jgi:phosphotriesterase-related protein
MRDVQTVTGPVPPAGLGVTLMHEHVFLKNPDLEANYPVPEWDEEGVLGEARARLSELAALGVGTIVDVTVVGLGRDVRRVQQVAEGSPVRIVAATGYFALSELPSYFRQHGPGLVCDEPEPLVRMFVDDVVEGIAGTSAKAGIIKVATDRAGLTRDVERVLVAAARAHLETGVPITTHTSTADRGGREQLALFRREGVDPESVVIGHCDTTDLDYLEELMDAGASIGIDRFGFNRDFDDEARIDVVVRLCELGYSSRITLSHDAAFWSVNYEPTLRAAVFPDWHHSHIFEDVVPTLLERGVSQAQLDEMLISNPMRILGEVRS